MEQKNLIILAAGIVVVAIIVLAVAIFALNIFGGNPSATPTPAPASSPTPGPSGATASVTPAAGASATPRPGGPLIAEARIDRNSSIIYVTMYPNLGATPIDASKLSIQVMTGGQTYSSGWVLKPEDWVSSNGNTLLESNEQIVAQFNTRALGIPQGQGMTVKVLQDGTELTQSAVTPLQG